MDFTASERGFEEVSGVHLAFLSAGADEGVEFVDEEDDAAFLFLDFFENGFEAFFEFAAVFGASDEGAEVEGEEFFVA